MNVSSVACVSLDAAACTMTTCRVEDGNFFSLDAKVDGVVGLLVVGLTDGGAFVASDFDADGLGVAGADW